MFCGKCGAQISDDSKFCEYCGQPAGAPVQQEVPSVYTAYTPVQPEMPMKMGWHKFLIYFALWAGAVMNLGTAISVLTGSQYGEYKNSVYWMFSAMRPLDMIYGVIILGLVAYQIYVRFQLAGFKVGAPKKLITMYALFLAVSCLYLFAGSVITGIQLFDSSSAGSLAGSIVMLFVNRTYYKHREHLFVNV